MRRGLPFLLLLLLLISCKEKATAPETQHGFTLSPTMLKTTQLSTVTPEFARNSLNFFGHITADNNKMVEIFPVVGGNVTSVRVELGDYVNKGQLLATIRSTEVAGIEKDLLDARSDLVVAQNKLNVARELSEGKLGTERDVVEAKADVQRAESQLRRLQEVYRIYSIKPGAIYEVRAPLSGFVIQKNINQDMILRNDRSDNIFDIAQIDEVWAIANVNESDISQVKMGMDAEITTISYPDKKFTGKVDKIYNIIDPDTKAMKCRVRLNNAGFLLKPDMRANIVLHYQEDFKKLAVPASALIFDNNRQYVMVFHSRNNIETREVDTFRQIGGVCYLNAGLKEGEQVMTTNQLLVYDALND